MEEIFGEFLKVNTFSVPNLGQNIKKNLTLMDFWRRGIDTPKPFLPLSDLCVSQKKIFSHEHTLYTSSTLSTHMEAEHGYCEYCKTHHYSDDELFHI